MSDGERSENLDKGPNPVEDGPGSSKEIVDDPELDALLDDALKDFGKPLPKGKTYYSKPNMGFEGQRTLDMNQVWSEEFIKEATAQFEMKMREFSTQGSKNDSANLHKVIEAATKAAIGENSNSEFTASLNEAIKNIAAKPDVLENPLAFDDQELSKLMNSFGMGKNVEDSEMDEILPFMTTMMQKLLSKELLQPVLTDIVDRYPDWLADNREKLSAEDFDKYNKQYEGMKRICQEYASEKPTDTADMKEKRFDRISELMLKVQMAGPPPKELVGEMGSGEAGAALPNLSALTNEQCVIM